MSPSLIVEVECPVCGATNRRREILTEVASGAVIAPREVVICRGCGAELDDRVKGGVPADDG